MDTVEIIALAMGVAWASGINLYAAIFVLGYMGTSGHIELPENLQILTDPLVMSAAGFMYLVEFFADKTPGVDTVWDGLHSFIRIPAGAVLAAAAVGEVSQAAQLAAFLIGGTVTAATHATKAGSRVLINASPEPVTNWTASVMEDVAVIAGMWTALKHPEVFIGLFIVFLLLMLWALPRIWRGIRLLVAKMGQWFGRGKSPPPGSHLAPPDRPRRLPKHSKHDS
jgi:hypothetical protein